jgi:predicted CXXCH cytochrome family protein
VFFIRIATALWFLLSAGAVHAGVITGSAHDFTLAPYSLSKMCVACHTAHNSDTGVTDAPLWNHTNSAVLSYTQYSSPTLDAKGLNLGGNSKLCMSCHDGTVAVESFSGMTGTTKLATKGVNLIGTELNDDHPVGFVYDDTLATTDGALHKPSATTVTIGSSTQTKTGTIAATMLFGGKMECSSCHDVHNTFTVGAKGSGLVKMDTAGSKLCLACHNK